MNMQGEWNVKKRGSEKGGWEENDSRKQRKGACGGHRVMRGVKCHKCHVSRPHKDKLCIAPKVRVCTHALD